jgi:hypothetical protein
VGFHDDKLRESISFGEVQDFKVCVLYENSIDLDEVVELENHWKEELNLYKLNLQFSKKVKVDRKSFWSWDLMEEIESYKLGKNCDRILYLVGRKWQDIAFETFAITLAVALGIKAEIQGAVEASTNTRGYIKAKYVSLLQLLFTSPKSTLVHEGYHLLGCPHALWKDDCYSTIKKLKEENKMNKDRDKIFASKSLFSGQLIIESRSVNSFFKSKLDPE